MWAGRAAATALLAVLLRISPAHAEERRLEAAIMLASEDPCLRHEALVQNVRGWLGRDEIAGPIVIRVAPSARRAVFELVRDGEVIASRRFEELPARCAERLAVVGLAIALAIDATILDSIGIPPPPAPAQAHERAPAGERVALSVEVELTLAVAILPEVALAGTAAIAVHAGAGTRLRFGALATQQTGADLGRGRVGLTLVVGRADACVVRTVFERVLLGGCAGLLVGTVIASGRGYARDLAPAIPWLAGSIRAETRWHPWDVLALAIAVEGLFPFVRPRLEVGDGAGGVIESRTLDAGGLAISVGAALVVD